MNTDVAGVLMLVDLQRDFLARPGLEPHPDALTACAAGWLETWRAHGRPVAHVLTRVERGSDRRMAHWKQAGLWICERNTPGELPPDCLAPRAGEPVFYKNGYLPERPDELAERVRAAGAGRVVLAGVMSHACVAHLAAAMLSAGLEVAWAAGALGSDRPQAAAHVLSHLAHRGVCELSLNGRDEPPADTVDARVNQARTALAASPPAWTATRTALLAWADLLDEAADELGCDVTRAVGKPVAMARDEVRCAAGWVRDTVRWRDALRDECRAGGVSARRPLGVVAVLTPWNNPVSIPVGRLAPALAWGNAAVWKPAPAAGAVSRRVLELALQAGLREALLRLCSGDADTGARLTWHAGIDAITFSGSLSRGRLVLAAAAERLVPCQLEMGGNNAAIVAEDADMADAAGEVLAGAFGFAGQRCTANRRVILMPGSVAVFLEQVRARLDDWAPCDPFDEACRIGPVKDSAAAERIEAVIARAAAAGARVTRSACAPKPTCVAPALVEGAAEDSEIVREETFGPVLVVQAARDWDDALRLLNAVPQGLAAALFSRSDARWEQFRAAARAGVLRRNESTAGALGGMPFGGWKSSGWGPAEHAEADAEFFTRRQAWVRKASSAP